MPFDRDKFTTGNEPPHAIGTLILKPSPASDVCPNMGDTEGPCIVGAEAESEAGM